MDLKSAIQSEVENVFKTALSIASIDLTFRVPVSASRDPATYQTTTTYQEHPFTGIIQAFTQKDVQASFGTIGINDKKIMVLKKGLSFEFTTHGEVIINGKIYPIIDITLDAAQTIYTINLKG